MMMREREEEKHMFYTRGKIQVQKSYKKKTIKYAHLHSSMESEKKFNYQTETNDISSSIYSCPFAFMHPIHPS